MTHAASEIGKNNVFSSQFGDLFGVVFDHGEVVGVSVVFGFVTNLVEELTATFVVHQTVVIETLGCGRQSCVKLAGAEHDNLKRSEE